MAKEQSCKNCLYSFPECARRDEYLCRRYPPVMQAVTVAPGSVRENADDEDGLDPHAGYWPIVEGGDWCGEWKDDGAD